VAIYEGPQGALRATPEIFSMPGPVNSMALSRLDEEATIDLAVAAGNSLVLLHGRDRRLSLDESLRAQAQPARLEVHAFPTWLKALAVGDYQGNDANEIAVLGFDESLRVLHSHPRRKSGWARAKNSRNGRN
jgi:hypothetical protein